MIFSWTVWGLRDHYGHSPQALATTFPQFSLFTKGDDMANTSLYGVVSDGRDLGIFVPLPATVLRGFSQGANISLYAGYGRIVFLSAVFVLFHSRDQSTLIPLPPSIRLS